MRKSKVTLRYAKSILSLSKEMNKIEDVYSDMLYIKNLCSQSKEFSLLLKSPIVKTDLKLKIFEEIFSDKISQLSMAFISLVTKKRRESLLVNISSDILTLYKEEKNITQATITTAIALDKDLKSDVIQFIKAHATQNVELNEVINEKIIGGAIISIGDKQLDASVSTKIKNLKQTFNKNLYLQDF